MKKISDISKIMKSYLENYYSRDIKEDSELHIEENYLDFEEGTSREDIWHWFDEKHSKGVYFLLYKYDSNNKECIEEELEEEEEQG